MRSWLGGALVALTLVLTACSGDKEPAGQAAAPTTEQSSTGVVSQEEPKGAPALPASPPTGVEIPKIKAKSPRFPLGLNADETIEVPPVSSPMQAGWYTKA